MRRLRRSSAASSESQNERAEGREREKRTLPKAAIAGGVAAPREPIRRQGPASRGVDSGRGFKEYEKGVRRGGFPQDETKKKAGELSSLPYFRHALF